MTLEELFLKFNSAKDAKQFMNSRLKELHEKGLSGKFYRIYARTYLKEKEDVSPSESIVDELNSPLKGGDSK